MGTVHAKAQNTNGIGIPRSEINYEECDDGKAIPLDVPARVDRIHIDGIGRTKNDIVETSVKDIFTASTFEEVLLKAHRARQRLETLYCFRNISIYVETSKGPKSTENGLEITFSVKELRRVVGGVTTQVGNNEGALIVGLRAPNLFGRGERLQVEYSYGSNRSDNFNVAFIKPFIGRHNPIFSTSLYQMHTEAPTSGYKELNRGVLFDFGFNSLPILKHNIQWDVAFRDMAALSRGSSFEIREQMGASMKSALRHILSIDLRDERIFPTCGSLLQLTTELAGIGGDVGFVKNEFYVQSNYPLVDDIVFQATLTGGLLHGISNDMKIGLSDMFYIGGPLSVRGFQTRGIGPRSDNDSLGSTCFWSGGLHLFTPLPFRPGGKGGLGDMFRTHFFLNAGNVGNLNEETTDDGRTLVERLTDNARISYGIGLALRLGQMARFEINYCFPHKFDKADRTQPGVQFGIGVQFL